MTEFDVSKLFSTSELHRRDITACGMTFPVYFRRLPNGDVRRFHSEVTSEDMEVRSRAGYAALVKSARQEDGTAFATHADYVKMDGEAVAALMGAFTEIHASKLEELGKS